MIPRLKQLSVLCAALRHPYVERDQIVAYQNKQLRLLITHAYDKVRYYRRLFDQHGIKPQDIHTVADLSAIPITTKKDLQALPVEEVLARGVNPQRLIIRRTSGSSGEPFTIRRTWLEEQILSIFQLRALYDFGLRMTDTHTKIVRIRPAQADADSFLLRILRAVRLYRKTAIECLQPPEDIVQALQRRPPNVVTGLPGVLTRIAPFVSDTARRVIHPRFVVVGGEVLTPLMRHQISAAFRAPVFNTYGSHEFKLLAWECRETGAFHTCDDGMILEVLTHNRPAAFGERGEVVATNLHSFAMPFIRYRLGDIVTRGADTCPCGKPFATIQAIQGRMIDYFPLPHGRMLHPYEIVSLVNDNSWIQQYRLIQEREDRITLQIVPFTLPSAQQLGLLTERVTKRLGPDIDFHIALVSCLPLEPGGKFRVSRSLVKSHYDEIDWEQLAIGERR